MAPEAQHRPALARDQVAPLVAKFFSVLTTIGFDDHPSGDAKEVDDIGPRWDRSAKLEHDEALVGRQPPTAKLSLGRRGPHFASPGAFVCANAFIGLQASRSFPRRRADAFFPREKGLSWLSRSSCEV